MLKFSVYGQLSLFDSEVAVFQPVTAAAERPRPFPPITEAFLVPRLRAGLKRVTRWNVPFAL
jgi:hypothetical protein